MKALVSLCLLAFLTGCLSATVQVDYDEQMRPVSCHATYVSLARDVEAAAFNVCGNSASSQHSASADVLQQALTAALHVLLK